MHNQLLRNEHTNQTLEVIESVIGHRVCEKANLATA